MSKEDDTFTLRDVPCVGCKRATTYTVRQMMPRYIMCPHCGIIMELSLTSFRPHGMVEGEMPAAEITITPTHWEER